MSAISIGECMADNEIENQLGPWQNADLRGTAKADAGLGADADIPSHVRFCSNVAKLVRQRLVEESSQADVSPAIFLLQPSPPSVTDTLQTKRVPMLDNGKHELNGRLWFVGAGPGTGHYVSVPAHFDDDQLFTYVTDELKLGSVQALVFEHRATSPYLRYYPNGLTDTDTFNDITLSAQITFKKISEIITHTYKKNMITPDAQLKAGKLWHKGAKWWPRSDAEQRVQMYLKIALNSALPTCTIRCEQSLPEGRLDIEILESEPNDRSQITQHGVLELKVLRSFRKTGTSVTKNETKKWIKSGVEQANAYRNSKDARWGALLCFDMRKQDVGKAHCFKHVKKLAKKLNLHLGRWFIYATSAQLRSASTSQRT